MGWSSKTLATPQNIRKRIDSAVEALEAAQVLMDRRHDMAESRKHASNAIAWANSARQKTMVRHSR